MKTRKPNSTNDLSIGMNITVLSSSCETRLVGKIIQIKEIRDPDDYEYPVIVHPDCDKEVDRGSTTLSLGEFEIVEDEIDLSKEEIGEEVDASYTDVAAPEIDGPVITPSNEMAPGEFYSVQILVPSTIAVTKVGGQIFRADKISGVINLKPFLGQIDSSVIPHKLSADKLTDLPF